MSGEAERLASGPAINDPVRLYYNDISQHDLLTKGDEVRLGRLVQHGLAAQKALDEFPGPPHSEEHHELYETFMASVESGEEASGAFFKANLRLVVSIAKSIKRGEITNRGIQKQPGSGVPLLDRIQAGNAGLAHAVGMFDPEKGFKFSTYATWWIRQAIQTEISKRVNTVRVPRHASDALISYRRSREQFKEQMGRNPIDMSEVLRHMGIPEQRLDVAAKMIKAAAAVQDMDSLDRPVVEDKSRSLTDTVVDSSNLPVDQQVMARELARNLVALVASATLTDRERQVIQLLYNPGSQHTDSLTQAEVAELLDISEDKVRTIKSRALRKLRNPAIDAGMPAHHED